MKIKYLFALSILLSLLVPRAAYAQAGFSEYFITVDPDSGTIHLIKEIPQVHWIYVGLSGTCVDQARGRYMFHGIDSAGAEHFYTLDATTGTVLYAPVVTVPSGDNWGELQYDDSLQRLFGIYWRSAEQLEYFISIDQVTGAFTFIDTIDGVNAIPVGLYSYDQHRHAYILSANQNLYTIDARTGAVLSSPILRTSLGGMHFDNATGTLYGNIAGTLMKIDPATADTTVINQIPWCQGTGGATMDEIHQRYITLGDSAGDHQIISLDTFGVPVSHPRFFQGQVSGENAIELCYDNSRGTLYGLHWHYDAATAIAPLAQDASITCYPNPSDGIVTFKISSAPTGWEIKLYSTSGQLVRTIDTGTHTEISLSLSDLPAGIYHYEILGCGHTHSNGNIVRQ